MASFRKIKIGWQVQIRKKGHLPITKSFQLKTDAQQWAREVEVQIERGFFQDPSILEKTTLREVLIRYRDEVSPKKRGHQYEFERINYFLRLSVSRLALASINNQKIASFRDMRLQTVANGTVRRELTILSHVFEVAIKDWGYPLPYNPVKMIRRPPEPQPRDRRLDGDEEERLFAACRGYRSPWLYPLVQMAIETGMRRGELLSLQWRNVDLISKTALLPMTKNGDQRIVPLTSKAATILQHLPHSIDGKVFPVKANAVNLAWQRIRKRADLGDLRFHDLRHEATSRFFEMGLNVMEVSAITGHKDLKMLKRYTHLRAEDLAKKLG